MIQHKTLNVVYYSLESLIAPSLIVLFSTLYNKVEPVAILAIFDLNSNLSAARIGVRI